MALDLGGIGGLLQSWIINPLLWLVIIFVFVGATWGFLLIRRKRKLIYECLEIVNHGSRKFSFNLLKCGWFGKKKFLRNLWDSGEEQMETKDGEIVYDFSTEDFQEINGKRGVICFRDPINQNILVPIGKCTVVNEELLAEIAPANFRDVAMDIIKDASKETSDWKERIIQYLIIGGVIIFALVSIIVIAQMVKKGQTEAADLIIQAGETCLKNAKDICSQIANPAAAGVP